MREQITLTVDQGIGILSIQRPEALNALSRDLVDDLDSLLEQIAENREIRVLVIYSPAHFASGADIKGMADCDPEEARAFMFTPTYNKLESLSIPTIAAMEGYAFGGGLELALRCDFRICAKDAKMGLPEINLGIMPGAGGTVLLPRLVGEARAMELIFFGKTVQGEDAWRMGLVHKAVEREALLDEAMEWARALSKKAPAALAAAKRSIKYGVGYGEDKRAMEYEAQQWCGLFETQDQKEGMKAFLEKRKPIFVGR